jgi:hypothetical protein
MGKFIPYVKVKQDALSYLGVVKQAARSRARPELILRTISSKEEIRMQYHLLASAQEF